MSQYLQEKNSMFFGQLLFIIVLITLGALIFFKLSYLLSSILGAITLYFLLRKPSFYLIEKKGWKPWLVSLMLISVSVVILLLLFYWAIEMVIGAIPEIHLNQITEELMAFSDRINDKLGFSLLSKDLIMSFKGFLTNFASNLLNSTYYFVLNLLMMVFVLYFMLAKGHTMEHAILRYSPFHGENLLQIKKEITNMIYGNAVGIPVVMMMQLLVSALGYWIVGFDRVFFFAFLTAFFGLVPIVGTAAIWVPLSCYLFLTGQIWQGIVLVIYSLLIVTNVDNLCRLVLMKSFANTHPLIVIFGVILGIPLFGFWGIIFGPLLISGFLLLLKIYYVQYKGFKRGNIKETE